MRELKFRLWNKKRKCFIIETRLGGIKDACKNNGLWGVTFGDIQQEERSIADYLIEDIVVQQYTGVKDINGVEIYEGDLVKVVKEHEAWIIGKMFDKEISDYDRGEIKWLCEAWKVCQKNHGACYLFAFLCCDEHPAALEVVGNIYEDEARSKND